MEHLCCPQMSWVSLPKCAGFCYLKKGEPRCQLFFPTRQEGVVRFYVAIRVCDASTPRPHPVSRQSSSPVDPAEYPARAARQWIPPSIPPELLASGSRRVSPSRRVSHQSSPPVDPAACRRLPVDPTSIPPEQLSSLVLLNVPPGTQLGLHFMLVPSCFECTLRLGKGDAFVLLWVVNTQLRLIPRRVSFWKGLGFC